MAYLVPGDLCDLNVGLLGAMDHSIATLTTCEVVQVSPETVANLTANYPILSRALHWAGQVGRGDLADLADQHGASSSR